MAQQLSVELAQINLLVGDISGNTRQILEQARQAVAAGSDVIAFPELSLTGYPPEDLLLRDSMRLRVEAALQEICAAALPVYIVVGHPLHEEGRLFNGLSVIHAGAVIAQYRKQALPNYEVFDEERYFTPGNSPCVVEMAGIPVALTICEDLWHDLPMAQVAQSPARLLININASPYHHGKDVERLELVSARARQLSMPVCYVNLVGGQDELVFDGGSLVVDAGGQCRVRAGSFSVLRKRVQMEVAESGELHLRDSDCAEALSLEASCYQALVTGLRDYIDKNGFPGIVLGLSGGIDSAVTLAIAVDALGADRVQAVMMPFDYTSELSLRLAETQARDLGVTYRVVPIGPAYHSFMEALQEEFEGSPVDVTEQNIQARCRGVMLMAISNKKGPLVLTTGNKSEIAVGYSTLYGDMAGGFNPLKDVYKTLVYRLAEYRNQQTVSAGEVPRIPEEVITRPPSAELAPDQRDEDSLPAYDRLDNILALYIEQDLSAEAIIEQGHDRDEVFRVLRLVDRNEYKRRQGPVGVRLTRKGFGRDRRYPITNGWTPGE